MFANNYDIVADLYDVYNQSQYDIGFYINRYKQFQGRIIELMAGTGRLAMPLLREGISIDCLDISAGLLSKLRKKIAVENLESIIINSDIRNMELDRKYDAMIIGFNSFSEIIDINDQKRVLGSISKYLNNNGEVIISLYNPDMRRKYINNSLSLINEYALETGKMLFFISSKENSNSIVDHKQFYEIYDTNGEMIHKKLLELRFKLITRLEIETLINETGFAIKEFYGDYDRSEFKKESPYMIYVLAKNN